MFIHTSQRISIKIERKYHDEYSFNQLEFKSRAKVLNLMRNKTGVTKTHLFSSQNMASIKIILGIKLTVSIFFTNDVTFKASMEKRFL